MAQVNGVLEEYLAVRVILGGGGGLRSAPSRIGPKANSPDARRST